MDEWLVGAAARARRDDYDACSDPVHLERLLNGNQQCCQHFAHDLGYCHHCLADPAFHLMPLWVAWAIACIVAAGLVVLIVWDISREED